MLRIITDSMSDYIHAAHRDSSVLLAFQPLRFGIEEYMDDGVSISQETFYARLRTCTELPKTSLVAMQTWKDVMKQALSDPEDTALVIVGSSRLSGGYQTAVQAADAVRELMSRQRLIGLADDLKYLVMGGRLNPLIGKVGGMLSIKPTLKLEGGQIE